MTASEHCGRRPRVDSASSSNDGDRLLTGCGHPTGSTRDPLRAVRGGL